MLTLEDSWPLKDTRPLDTVFGKSRGVGDRANGEGSWRSVHVELTLAAAGDGGEDDTRVALEACNELHT